MCVCPPIPDSLIITVADTIEPGTLLKPSNNIIMTYFPLQFQLNNSIAEKHERATLLKETLVVQKEGERQKIGKDPFSFNYQEVRMPGTTRQTFPWN